MRNDMMDGFSSRRLEGHAPYLLPGQTTPNAHDDGVQLRDVSSVLRRHIRLIGGALGGTVLLALVVTLLITPVWESLSSLRIDEKQQNLSALDVLDRLAGTEVNTEIQVIKSRSLAEQITDSLGLQLRMLKPRGLMRSEVFTDIRVSHAPGASGPQHPKSALDRVAGKIGSLLFDSTVYRVSKVGPNKYDLENKGTGRHVATLAAGDRVTLNDVSAAFTPRDTSEDRFEFSVAGFSDAVDDLQDGFDVARPDPLAQLVQIKYKDTDLQLVTQVPNGLMSHYIAQRQDNAHSESRSTVKFLTEQLAQLSTRVTAKEDTLRRYQEKMNIVSLPDEARTSVERTAALRAQRADIDAERSALQQLVRQLDHPAVAGGESPYRQLIAFPTLLRNQAATQLLTSLATEEDKRADLLSRRSMEDPDVQVLTTRISQLESQLRSLAVTYLQGLTEQVTAIDQQLVTNTRDQGAIPSKTLELARLSREPRVLDTMYVLLQTRLKEAEIAAAVPDPSVRVIDMATTPSSPARPKPLINLAMALVAGMLLGVAGAFAREYVDKTVRTRKDVLSITGIPVLGFIPHIRRPNRWVAKLKGTARGRRVFQLRSAARALNSGDGAMGEEGEDTALVADEVATAHLDLDMLPVTEAYNRLATNLAFARPEEVIKTIVITSPLPRDGKTTVGVNLAATMAQRGRKVLLVDADLRRGLIHAVFRSPRSPGLSEVLAGEVNLHEAIRQVEVGDHATLHFFATGALPPNPAQLLGGERVRELLEFLKGEYDTIILEAPPLNVVSDAALLASNSDGVVVVARSGVTGLNALSFAMEQLRHVRARVIGTVLNDISYDRDANDDYSGMDASYYAKAVD